MGRPYIVEMPTPRSLPFEVIEGDIGAHALKHGPWLAVVSSDDSYLSHAGEFDDLLHRSRLGLAECVDRRDDQLRVVGNHASAILIEDNRELLCLRKHRVADLNISCAVGIRRPSSRNQSDRES